MESEFELISKERSTNWTETATVSVRGSIEEKNNEMMLQVLCKVHTEYFCAGSKKKKILPRSQHGLIDLKTEPPMSRMNILTSEIDDRRKVR